MVKPPPEPQSAIRTWLFAAVLTALALGTGAVALEGLVRFINALHAGNMHLMLDPYDGSAVILAIGLLVTAIVVVVPSHDPGPKVGRRKQEGRGLRVGVVWLASVVMCLILGALAPSFLSDQGERLAKATGYQLCAQPLGERRGLMRWVKGGAATTTVQCPRTWKAAVNFDNAD